MVNTCAYTCVLTAACSRPSRTNDVYRGRSVGGGGGEDSKREGAP